jgi:hypothetical protein
MSVLSDPTTWRLPFSASGFTYLHAPATILAATCTTVNPVYPLATVTYGTVTSGAYADIKPGMTIMFGSAAGLDDMGRQRVRAAADGTDIPIGRSSRGRLRGEVDLSSGGTVYITVLELHEVWSRIPFIDDDAVLFKDEQSYSDTLALAPIANAGPHVADFVDPDTDTLTLDFDGTASFSPVGDAITYAWDFGDATPSSSTSSAPTGIVFPPGARYIYLTVTAGGRTHTCAVLVAALEKSGVNAPILVEVGTRVLNPEGQTASLTVRGANIPISTYPRGTQVIYFERERYGTSVGSLAGPAGREHVKFNGWLDTEPTEISAAREGLRRQVTLNCADVAERLRKIPQFPQVLHRKDSPANWAQIKSSIANLNGAILYYLRHHTTALELADFTRSAVGNSYTFSLLAGEQGSPYAQADRLARAMRHRLTCNERGQLAVVPYPQYLPTAAQASEFGLTARASTPIVALGESDWSRLRYTDSQPPGIHWNNGSAIVVSTQDGEASGRTDTPLFCIAPGTAPGQGLSAQESGEQLVLSQNELNVIEGNRYAANNAVQSLFELELTRGGDAGIDPALMEWVTLTLSSATAAQRGLTLSAQKLLPVQVEYELDGRTGVKRQRLTLERETSGQPATTVVRTSNEANLPPYTPPSTYYPTIDYEIPDVVSYFPSGGNRLALILSDGTVERTSTFSTPSAAGGPSWSSVSIPGITGTVIQWCPDASAPENGWVVTTDEVGYLEDLFGTLAYTVQHTFGSTTDWRAIDFSFGAGGPGLLGCIISYYGSGGGTKSLYTADGGATWTGEVTVNANYDTSTGGNPQYPACFVSSKVSGLIYASAYINTGPFAVSYLYKSTNGGATWTSLTAASNNYYISNEIHAPWHDNAGDALIYYNSYFADGPLKYQLNSFNGSTFTQDLGPNDGSYLYGGALWIPARGLIKTLTTNRRIMLLSAGAFAPSEGNYGIWRTDNIDLGPTHWTQVTTAADGYTHVAFVENDPSGRSFYLYGPNGAIGYCIDGATADDRTGDLVTSATVRGIAG